MVIIIISNIPSRQPFAFSGAYDFLFSFCTESTYVFINPLQTSSAYVVSFLLPTTFVTFKKLIFIACEKAVLGFYFLF